MIRYIKKDGSEKTVTISEAKKIMKVFRAVKIGIKARLLQDRTEYRFPHGFLEVTE